MMSLDYPFYEQLVRRRHRAAWWWLAGDRLPTSYVASQGTVIGRRGRVHIERDGDTVWVAGDARTVITGHLTGDVGTGG